MIPQLAIADRLPLDDRSLHVRGDLRTYKIHLGSGNILMEPNDQYLCIVPSRSPDANALFLPFDSDVRAVADPVEGLPPGEGQGDQGPGDRVADQRARRRLTVGRWRGDPRRAQETGCGIWAANACIRSGEVIGSSSTILPSARP